MIQKKTTWAQYYKILCREFDKQIKDAVKKSGSDLVYAGGTCKFSSTEISDEFNKKTMLIVKGTLYFKKQFSKNNAYKEIVIEKKMDYCKFDYENDNDTLLNLRQVVSEPFEVNVISPIE